MQKESDSDSDWDSELDLSDDEEFKAEERAAHAEDASDPRKAKDILLYELPPQPSRAEIQKLKTELEAKKARKEAKYTSTKVCPSLQALPEDCWRFWQTPSSYSYSDGRREDEAVRPSFVSKCKDSSLSRPSHPLRELAATGMTLTWVPARSAPYST